MTAYKKVYIVREISNWDLPKAYFDKAKALEDLKARMDADFERTRSKPDQEYTKKARIYKIDEYEVQMPAYDARTTEQKVADLQADVTDLKRIIAEQQEQIGSLQQGYLQLVEAMKRLHAGNVVKNGIMTVRR